MTDLRRQGPRVAVLDQRWGHHGQHSGYLINSGVGQLIPRDDRLLPYKVGKWLSKGDARWEQRLIWSLLLRIGDVRVAHLVDGDFDTWAYSKRPNWLKTRITATFHQPLDKLEEIASNLRVGMLDGIVCVSRDQIPILQHLVPTGRCVFIPHGVDTDFFAPQMGLVPDTRPLLLSVGTHRRDFATLIGAGKIIKRCRPDIRILAIGSRDRLEQLKPSGIIETASDVSDTDLRATYLKSSVLFMPLEAATANNALLESMAAGRPAVVTDLPAIRDYATADSAVFCPRGDAEAHALAAIKLVDDEALRNRMGLSAHVVAAQFSWPTVRRSLSQFLLNIAEN